MSGLRTAALKSVLVFFSCVGGLASCAHAPEVEQAAAETTAQAVATETSAATPALTPAETGAVTTAPQAQAAAEEAAGETGLLGAAAVLERLRQEPDDAGVEKDSQASLADRLAVYAKAWPTMPPEQAGLQWLALVQAWYQEEADSMGDGTPFELVLTAMPGPAVWPALSAAVAALADPAGAGGAADPAEEAGPDAVVLDDLSRSALGLFAAVLNGDQDAMSDHLAATTQAAEELDPWQTESVREATVALRSVIIAGGKSDPAAEFRAELKTAQSDPDEVFYLQVPDLVTLVGPEQARELLGQLLVTRVDSIYFRQGEKTRELAREVALQVAGEMPRPRWSLVDGLDSTALYEAMAAKFLAPSPQVEPGDPAPDDQQDAPAAPPAGRRSGSLLGAMFSSFVGGGSPTRSRGDDLHEDLGEAWGYYVLGLVAQGRTEDAAAQLRQGAPAQADIAGASLPYGALKKLDHAGFSAEVFLLLDELLGDDPSLGLWEMYCSLAVRTGHADQLLERAQAALQTDALSRDHRLALKARLVDARLAIADDDETVAAAVASLMELRESAKRGKHYAKSGPASTTTVALTLAEIGIATAQPELTAQGLDLFFDVFDDRKSREARERLTSSWQRAETISFFVQAGRLVQAEKLLLEAFQHQAAESRRESGGFGGLGGWGGGDEKAQILADLVSLYHQAGRHGDVLALLRDAADWGQADLADMLDVKTEGTPLALMAAAALQDAGRGDEAVPIIRTVIDMNPGLDAAYAQLRETLGPDAIPILDELAASDRYQERPLIWKARALLDAGQPAQAEATVRAAIKIDPSDGEQGRGDRMRAYTVLADALRAQGDEENAAFFDGVIAAIRMSEDADRLYSAGLLTQGINLYKQSLSHFSDAYCIQSRMAIQLVEMGRTKDAAEHYRRAFELMPSSFGRVESHCFGCEGAFAGPQAQGIAEEVFTQLAIDDPDNPQVHYLLGYLRSSQGRHLEAFEAYARAVELDPLYLNAWKEILNLADAVHLPTGQRDAAALKLIGLDPLGRHARGNTDQVYDLKALWHALQSAQRVRPERPEQLFALPASAAALDQATQAAPAIAREMEMYSRMRNERRQPGRSAPGKAISRHAIGRFLQVSLQASRAAAMHENNGAYGF